MSRGLPDNKCQTLSYIVKTHPRALHLGISTELNYYEAAEYLGIHHRILRRARQTRQISPAVYGHKTVRFSIEELERFKRRHLTAAIA